jgi:hypothetical protein
LKITHDFRSAEWPDQTKVATRWSTIKEAAKKLTTQKPLQLPDNQKMEWPIEFNMHAWTNGRRPLMPEVLTFNVLDMIAEQLINPELVYGWGDV